MRLTRASLAAMSRLSHLHAVLIKWFARDIAGLALPASTRVVIIEWISRSRSGFAEAWPALGEVLRTSGGIQVVHLNFHDSSPLFQGVGNFTVDLAVLCGLPLRHFEACGIRVGAVPACWAKLKGSIGEGSNHSNFSHQSSVKILAKFSNSRQKNSEKIKKSGHLNIF